MLINVQLVWVVYFIIFILGFAIVKVLFQMDNFKKFSKIDEVFLSAAIERTSVKLQENSRRNMVFDDLQKSLFNRVFFLTQELILVNKQIIEKYIN